MITPIHYAWSKVGKSAYVLSVVSLDQLATENEEDKTRLTRAKANDPLALQLLGAKLRGEGDYKSAFKYWSMAADLRNAEAHYQLALMFALGHGVEQNEAMFLHHSEESAINGHHIARYNLGCYEKENHRMTRAVSHFLIGANLGCDDAVNMLREMYSQGFVKKDDFAAALRAHQAAVSARKSPERAVAEEVIRTGKALPSTIVTESSSHHVLKK